MVPDRKKVRTDGWTDDAKTILCTISLAISYDSNIFCAHLCAVLINLNCNEKNRILGK